MGRVTKKHYRVTQKELSELTGIEKSVLSRKTSNGTLFRHSDGRYDVAVAFHSLNLPLPEHLQYLAVDDPSPNSSGEYVNFEEWRAKKEKEMALIKGMEREELEGALVRKSDITKEVQGALNNVKIRLLAIPSKIGPLVAHESNPAITKTLIEDAIREALAELSGLYGDPEGMLPSAEASTTPQRRRVGASGKATQPRSQRRTPTEEK